MKRFATAALTAAILAAPSASFAASFSGDEGAFFEQNRPARAAATVDYSTGGISVAPSGASGIPGYIVNRADVDNDGRLNAEERQRAIKLQRFIDIQG